jgi:preprotein translocase subunit SecG
METRVHLLRITRWIALALAVVCVGLAIHYRQLARNDTGGDFWAVQGGYDHDASLAEIGAVVLAVYWLIATIALSRIYRAVREAQRKASNRRYDW